MQGGGANGTGKETESEQLTASGSRSVAPSSSSVLQSQNGTQPVGLKTHLYQEFQDDMEELVQRYKHYEEVVNNVKDRKSVLNHQILNMQVDLGNIKAQESGDPDPSESEEEITNRILKHERSAAAFFCRLSNLPEAKTSSHPLTKDVLGVVATLGKVNDRNLSRILSNYLGLDTMLGVVCQTSEGVKALEAYKKGGSINESSDLHAFAAASIGMPLDNNFRVFCLENIRPYGGGVIYSMDVQRRLDLLKPTLNGVTTPDGFLGFAVNMIAIDRSNLFRTTKDGKNLRATLFYELFSSLQVYETKEHMRKALPAITHGAISLDGGMFRGTSIIDMEDVDIKFPGGASGFLPLAYVEMGVRLKEAKWEKRLVLDNLKRHGEELNRTRLNVLKKKQEYLEFLAKLGPIL